VTKFFCTFTLAIRIFQQMKFSIEKRTKSDLQVGLIYAFIGIVGLILAFFLKSLPRLLPPCLFRTITGVPCPACGATRTGILISHFKIMDAFLLNPLFFVLFLCLAVWGINSIIGLLFGKNVAIELDNKESKILRLTILIAIPLNWFYMIIKAKFLSG